METEDCFKVIFRLIGFMNLNIIEVEGKANKTQFECDKLQKICLFNVC